jgi:hypothetical protein
MKKVFNKAEAQNTEEGTTTDFKDCNDAAVNELRSSFVFVTGCMYRMNAENFNWLHSFAINTLYTNFERLQHFLIYFAFIGVSASNCDNVKRILVISICMTTFQQVFSHKSEKWEMLNTKSEELFSHFPTNKGELRIFESNYLLSLYLCLF